MKNGRYRKAVEHQTLLLDAAEKLFATHGYEATTTRLIASATGLRVAAVNYYFETKLDLAIAVLARRFEPLAAAREAALEHALSHHRGIRGIIEAFIVPHARMTSEGGAGWQHYNHFMAGVSVSGHWPSNAFATRVDLHAKKFIVALQEELHPDNAHIATRAYRFMLGTVLAAFAAAGSSEPQDARLHATGFGTSDLVEYTVAGVSAVLGRDRLGLTAES